MTETIQGYAEHASATICTAATAVEKHLASEDLRRMFVWFAGLAIYAYEHRLRSSDPLDGRFEDFMNAVVESCSPAFSDRFGTLVVDEEDEVSFAEAVDDAWNDADDLWPSFIDNVRSGLGVHAFTRALKENYMFEESADLRTVAFLMNGVLLERLGDFG